MSSQSPPETQHNLDKIRLVFPLGREVDLEDSVLHAARESKDSEGFNAGPCRVFSELQTDYVSRLKISLDEHEENESDD